MTRHIFQDNYLDNYEYHGNTSVEYIRKRAGAIVWRDWFLFDTVEEAQQFFNDKNQE